MSLPALALIALAAALSLGIALSLWRNPILRAIALRNIAGRKGSTALVITGSMVGTALIAGSLVIGDTTERQNHSLAYTRFGEIDEVVFLPGANPHGEYFARSSVMDKAGLPALNALTQASHKADLVDGALPVIQELVPVQKVDAAGRPVLVEPRVVFLGLDPEEAARFGAEPLLLPRLGAGEVVASRSLARELELQVGDTVQVFVGNRTHPFRVREIIADSGLVGYRTDPFIGGIGGTLLGRLEDWQRALGKGPDEVNALLISNRGGVIDGGQHTGAVQEALVKGLQGAAPSGDFQVLTIKEWLTGENWLGQMFLTISAFAVVAGVMLVINIYAMLAEERRSEMGTMRAIGGQRGALARLYLYEGMVYTLGATLMGVAVGLLLAMGVVWGMNQGTWFATMGDEFHLVLKVKPQSLLVAGSLGVLITLGTVLFTSYRVSRVNIVAAIRDLPDPQRLKAQRRSYLWSILLFLLGVGLTAGAVASDSAYLYILGPVAAVLGASFALRSHISPRAMFSLALLGFVAYSLLVTQVPAVKEELDEGPTIFFFTGVLLVLSSIGLLVLNFPAVTWLVRQTLARLRGILPAVRVGVAYPAERPTRTGLSLGMFALIVYIITVASIFQAIPRSHIEELSQSEMGGFDAILEISPRNPIDGIEARLRKSELVEAAQIIALSPIHRGTAELPQFKQADYQGHQDIMAGNPEGSIRDRVRGLDQTFLLSTRSRLSVRAPEYASDAEAWAALARNPDLVILDVLYHGKESWNPRPALGPGDVVQLRNPAAGAVYEKRVIGRMSDSPIWEQPLRGIMMNGEAVQEEFGGDAGAPPTTYLLEFSANVDKKAVANAIEKEFILHGAQVRLVSELLDESVSSFLNFFRIIQGFLAFGLVIGVAGLGVVAARAVYQRRQEIGTLRALGFQRRMVVGYFLVEASFVSGLGILLGMAAGTLSGYVMYLDYWREEAGFSFTWPALELVAMAGAVGLASLVFTFLPARHAASLAPVAALRPRE